MSATSDIICSRCGTPFPRERGKVPVNCVICGQLRPDLDMTLDDPSDLPPAPPPTSSPKASPAAQLGVARGMPDRRTAPASSSRPFVAMSEIGGPLGPVEIDDSLADLIGPVLLIAMPFGAFMAGGLAMLCFVSDFSTGAWYAVGTVAVIVTSATILAGLLSSGILFLLRFRRGLLIRVVFTLAALAVGYLTVTRLPPQMDIRPNAFPALRLR